MAEPRILSSGIVDARFGENVRVVQPVNLYGCTIGDDCVVSHGAKFINDPFSIGGPAHGDRNLWRATRVGNHVSIGTNATILPVSICDHVVVGAGAVVTKDLTEPGVYAGNPARLLRRLNQ